jgi:hypothetical protein
MSRNLKPPDEIAVHNLERGHLFDADPGQQFKAV